MRERERSYVRERDSYVREQESYMKERQRWTYRSEREGYAREGQNYSAKFFLQQVSNDTDPLMRLKQHQQEFPRLAHFFDFFLFHS